MECYNCEKSITKYNKKQLCRECTFDPTIVISLTDVKRKYKLTEKELEEAALFSITFQIHRNTGTKYIISEVEKLAEEITKDLEDTDKRKIAFLRQKIIMKQIKTEKENLLEKKQKIEEHVKVLMQKLDHTEDINECLIIELIDKYLKDPNISIFDAAYNVFNDIVKIIEEHKKKREKRENMDILINEKIDRKYIKKAKEHPTYHEYIEKEGLSIKKCYSKIENFIIKEINKIERKKRMNKLLKKTIPQDYMKDAIENPIYANFVESGDIDDIDNIALCTKDYVGDIIAQKNRKREIDKRLNEMALDPKSQKYPAYNEYIQNKITLKEAVDKIENIFEGTIRRNNKKEKIK